jgi:hypothetical protein
MISPGKAEKHAARKVRLAAALRENLKRRKAQARGRARSDPDDEDLAAEGKAEPQAPDFRRNQGRD